MILFFALLKQQQVVKNGIFQMPIEVLLLQLLVRANILLQVVQMEEYVFGVEVKVENC